MNTKQIDDNLDAVLRASGSALKHYSMQLTLDNMRAAMSKAMHDPVREELVAALEAIDPLFDNDCTLLGVYGPEIRQARAALAKAKGQGE